MENLMHVVLRLSQDQPEPERYGSGETPKPTRVAVRWGTRLLEVTTLAGGGLYAANPKEVLAATAFQDKEFPSQCIADHRGRRHPFRVDERWGQHGAVDYIISYLKDEAWKDIPRGGGIHVSMCSKLNRGLKLWTGDVPPLLAKLYEKVPQEKLAPEGRLSLEVAEPFTLIGVDFVNAENDGVDYEQVLLA